ncbi:hypothetical protein TWF694_006090 [Orbilia ellipsospora]|uniref:Uncharacterized protein n=1 Tax=Orbilia ellipsospora TaxID=2528407 RepID=A0AAV9WRG5_9PEZI
MRYFTIISASMGLFQIASAAITGGKATTLNQYLRNGFVRTNSFVLDRYAHLGTNYQADHFIEIQHVVKLIADQGEVNNDNLLTILQNGNDARNIRLNNVAAYVNAKQNLFRLPAAENQAKAGFLWSAYRPGHNQNPYITNYLGWSIKGTSATVQQSVHVFATAMAHAQNHGDADMRYVNYVGNQICLHMGWACNAYLAELEFRPEENGKKTQVFIG